MRAWMLGGGAGVVQVSVVLIVAALSVPPPAGQWPNEEPAGSSDWHIYVVNYTGVAGYGGTLALDEYDLPHLSLNDWNSQSVKYARWDGVGWSIETVDANDHAYYSSIALDSDGLPHIAYDDPENDTLMYAWSDGNSWWTDAVYWTGFTVSFPSLSLDEDDYPLISYRQVVDYPACDDIRLASWNGTAWSNQTVECVFTSVGTSSLASDSHGNAHVAYGTRHANDDYLTYAKWNGTAWEIQTVDSGEGVGRYPRLALDADDRPHIAYTDYANKDLKYAAWNGTAWKIETVESTGDMGWSTSIALDSSGNPHICHVDQIERDLRYVWWNGSAWTTEIVDHEGDVGWIPSLAIDSDDLPHVSYFDNTNGMVKFATKADLAMPPVTTTLDIDPDTLNLKSKGRWITAYLSAENASVYDIDVSTILLQDALAPERWDYQNDVLMLKFNRQEFKDTMQVGESVQVKITGKWEDGTEFEAYDSIRVIEP